MFLLEKKAMSREEILTTIKGLAEKLGYVPSLDELKTMTPVGRRTVRRLFKTYGNALRECGMKSRASSERIWMSQLFDDWAKVAQQLKRLPTAVEYEQWGAYSIKPLQKRCGSWGRVPHMMMRYAQAHGLEQQWPDVMALARADMELDWPAVESLWPAPGGPGWGVFTNRPVYGTPMNLCPLAHAPTNEMGVVFLFGVMARDLGYIVTLLQTEFPDCEALRRMTPEKWQRLRIEFEFESRNFLTHGHDVNGCDMIICWKHNWPECPLEVVELSKFVGKLLPQIEKA
jgi:hypothetical protein